MKAKRVDAGWYEYRGYTVQDHGAGNSTREAMARFGGRWHIYKGTSFGADQVDRAHTLAGAKEKVDALASTKQSTVHSGGSAVPERQGIDVPVSRTTSAKTGNDNG